MSGSSPKQPWVAVALLALAIVSATLLTALGHMTKTELLPLLGGTVVVAHRLIDASLQRRNEPTDRTKSKTIPPSSAGVPVVFGMLGGGLATLASQGWW